MSIWTTQYLTINSHGQMEHRMCFNKTGPILFMLGGMHMAGWLFVAQEFGDNMIIQDSTMSIVMMSTSLCASLTVPFQHHKRVWGLLLITIIVMTIMSMIFVGPGSQITCSTIWCIYVRSLLIWTSGLLVLKYLLVDLSVLGEFTSVF